MVGLRITTWNVNGIRNPFGYQPWREKRTFEAMFDILEADIVVMQETKIQRKDLRDDMVLVPGWDVHFSLPKHKKGYSGVAIYTRTSMCTPIRAEEGITGILTPPNSTTCFCDLPEEKQIGGYPSASQLSRCALDASTLDSEGRCVILEFPAFVLIGVYSPANRDESRDEFRLGFLNALDARVRNLVDAGKRVFLTGDLNIIREEIDTANAEERLRKHGTTGEEFVSTPARRLFNQLLIDGKVIGGRDKEREKPVLVDLCRSFHAARKGMFTCWETKINARPGNFGARIDFVLCSEDLKGWFSSADIQEGLIGSDHCPVYAILEENVTIAGTEFNIKDVMNPPGMFKSGQRQRDWSPKDLQPTSARLIPEFDRRRSILDMFQKKPSLPAVQNSPKLSGVGSRSENTVPLKAAICEPPTSNDQHSTTQLEITSTVHDIELFNYTNQAHKRSGSMSGAARSSKRSKSSAASTTKGHPSKSQSSLTGFFKPKSSDSSTSAYSASESGRAGSNTTEPTSLSTQKEKLDHRTRDSMPPNRVSSKNLTPSSQESVIDPIVSKESWSKILGKRIAPRCEHDEPCISFKTKKPGENCGRSFYMCSRPLGPSGQKEKHTQWRCGTFICKSMDTRFRSWRKSLSRKCQDFSATF